MKTIKLITIVVLLFTLQNNAQITKGNWMVGGSGNFTSSNVETTNKSTNISSNQSGKSLNVQPNIGYFFVDKLAVGLTPKVSVNFVNNETNTTYAFGVFTRYYLLKPEKLVNIVTHVEYLHAPLTNNSTSELNNWGFKAGPTLFFNESVALELTLDYIISRTDSSFSTSTFKTFGVSLGFQIHLKK